MSKFMFLILSILFTAQFANAGCFSDDGYGSDCHIDPVTGAVLIGALAFASCAPEVKEGNVAAADRTLKKLISSPDFTSALKFKKIVGEIQKDKRSDSKIKRYFDLVDVDANNQTQVVEFMGQRELRASQLNSLERKADLTPAQSALVVNSLNQSLRGSLQ